MLMVISPAKALNFAAAPPDAPLTMPAFSDETLALSKVTRRLSARDLKALMGISDDLAKLNRQRFLSFDAQSEDGVQAAFAFNGDVYRGLRARDFDKAQLRWAQDHLRILSGLYGLLRPLDAIQPYRLEMGSRLKTRRGGNLYAFWGNRLAAALAESAAGHRDPALINLASQEYFAAVDVSALALPVITCHFQETRDGERRALGFAAKRARGLMARWIIEGRLEEREALKGFDAEGYRYDLDASTEADWVFARPAVTGAV